MAVNQIYNPKLKTAVIFSNLGTPDSAKPRDVKKYLNEFLMDKNVISLPWPLRALLVKGVILNTRPKKSAHAYEKIWTDRGSPLLYHSQDLLKKIKLPENFHCFLAMRYGNPSFSKVCEQISLGNFEQILFLPLYPQYSQATTYSSLEHLKKNLKSFKVDIPCFFLPHFYNDPEFVKSFAEVGKKVLQNFSAQKILFSYHGLPEKMLTDNDPSKTHCLKKSNCCETYKTKNPLCYKAQCLQTTKAIQQELQLPDHMIITCFQSRLGKAKWIQPYTENCVIQLAKEGVKRVAVFSPAFVADCLETLEEIAIGLKETFQQYGGQDLLLIPSLNSSQQWTTSLTNIIQKEPPPFHNLER